MINFILIVAMIAIDQLSKYLTVIYLKPVSSVPIINGFISLTYAENKGAAFSMLENKIWFFVLVTILALCAMLYLYKKKIVKHKVGISALILVSSGAIGNLIDRVMNGYVIDMFEFTFFNFAIFNIADIYITFGGVLLCFYILFLYDKDSKVVK